MLKKVLIGIAVVIVAILGYATTKPDAFRVERSTSIAASPETIYANLVDFHAWGAWSPWEKLDPTMTRTYGGAPNGVGATYAWTGNSDVGTGAMEITNATPSSRVEIKLDFLKPIEGHNQTVFTITPAGPTTNVSWVMEGPSNYMGKVMSVFVSMDKLIGKDFESGLANLKAVSEK